MLTAEEAIEKRAAPGAGAGRRQPFFNRPSA